MYKKSLKKLEIRNRIVLDWVAQTSIKFKSQLNPRYKLIPCAFKVILSVD